MMVKAGDRARESGDYQCTGCDGTMHVDKGQKIPECPCGCKEFSEQVKASSGQSSSSSQRK